MEESEEILLKSLENAGVSISKNVSSIRELTNSETLILVCAQCLNLIHDETSSFFPTSLPDSMVDKFKICTDIALAFKRLGFVGDINYYKFLYPSKEDSYKLVRFLVERLSESSDGVKIANLKDVNARKKVKEDESTHNLEDQMEKADNEGLNLTCHEGKLENLTLHSVGPWLSNYEAEDASFSGSRASNLSEGKQKNVVSGYLYTEEGESGLLASGKEEIVAQRDDTHVQKLTSLREQSYEVRFETEKLQNQGEVLMAEMTTKTKELQHLEQEFELLNAATEMAFDDQHPIHFYLEQLSEQVDAKKCKILELESQWDAFRIPLEEKKRSLEESLYASMPEAQEKLQKLREVELEKQSISSEIKKREEEHSKLSEDLGKQPRLPSRASYVERIKEITKNSRKQDADIERILRETRELQLESNSIQERLLRTYAVLDEIVFREAKKDPVGRQAYRMLTSIHESFEQISEKILTADRIRREVAEIEKKLATMAFRSLNVDKLQADLDAIVKENEYLEQRLRDN